MQPSATAIQQAVQGMLREDRNANGVPDALENAWLQSLHTAAQATPTAQSAQARPSGVALGVGLVWLVVSMVGTGFITWVNLKADRSPRRSATPVATAVATPTLPVSTTSASAVPSPPATAASAKKPAASITPTAVASKLTDEQWGRQAVAAQSSGLLGCMEQDLVRNPNAPKAYTVSVLIESDGAPLNSSTTFSPTASSGFTMCARNVIFYGFNGRYGSGPPSHKPFTFATSVAFPNAKPAAKAESGRGWD